MEGAWMEAWMEAWLGWRLGWTLIGEGTWMEAWLLGMRIGGIYPDNIHMLLLLLRHCDGLRLLDDGVCEANFLKLVDYPITSTRPQLNARAIRFQFSARA